MHYLPDHSDCCCDDNCGGPACPAVAVLRARQARQAPAWSELELRRESGGLRHYLDGQSIHCGALLELQAVTVAEDDRGDYSVRLPTGERVRYEAQIDGGRSLSATLHKFVGGYEFRARVERGMRFRWPVRS